MKTWIGVLVVCLMVMVAGSAMASGGRPKKPNNWDIFGSDDRQSNHKNNLVVTEPMEPKTPVQVPEPATFWLLGTGVVGLGLAVRRRYRK